jgi:hypothetical protein
VKQYSVSIRDSSASRVTFSCHPADHCGWAFNLLVMRDSGNATVLTRTQRHASAKVAAQRRAELHAAVAEYIKANGIDCAEPTVAPGVPPSPADQPKEPK